MTKFLLLALCRLRIILQVTLCFWCITKGLATDIEVLSSVIDTTLGHDVQLPVLFCHSRNSGYRYVTWYKDGMAVQSSYASLPGHMLSLRDLLSKPLPNVFNNTLKLQGQYWCETDLNFTQTVPQRFLFRIENVHTYIGSLVARNDYYLPSVTHRTFEEDRLSIAEDYEEELQDILFAFLPMPNSFVTGLSLAKEGGFVVDFAVYHQLPVHRRLPTADWLQEDENQLTSILDYLNDPAASDEEYRKRMKEWTEQHGVTIADIKISSASGCYQEITFSDDKNLTWPYALIGDVVVSEEGCLTEYQMAVTRMCNGEFSKGAEWGPIEGDCAAYPHQLSLELLNLQKSPDEADISEDVRKLVTLTENPKDLTVLDLHLATSVLRGLSKRPLLNISEVSGFLTTVDNVLNSDSRTLIAAKNSLGLSNRMMEAVDDMIAATSDKGQQFTIAKSHVIASIKRTTTENNHIVGVSVLPSESGSPISGSVRFIANGSDVTALQSTVGFVLPSDLILKREKDLLTPCQLDMVYFNDWRLFPDPKQVMRYRNHEALATPVIRVGITGGLAWNLTDPIRFYFRDDFDLNGEKPLCSYYDEKLNNGFGGWATEGCTLDGLHNGYYVCHCHHLCMLSLVVPQNPWYTRFRPSRAIFIGCGLSIVFLSLVVLLYCCSGEWRTDVNHHILFYLALAMLFSLALLLIHNIESHWRPGCMMLTIIFHYFVQVTFCWLLVQSLVYHSKFCRNVEITDYGKFLTRANVFAWDFPFVIVGITWVVLGSQYYKHKVCWPTMGEISNIIFYPVVFLLLLTLCFNAIAAYCITCTHFKDLEVKKLPESTLKFKIAISVFIMFFLSWIFGYLSLHKKPVEYQILFSISITVTSLYILLFFLFQDITPNELYKKMTSKFKKTPLGDSKDALSGPVKTYNSTD